MSFVDYFLEVLILKIEVVKIIFLGLKIVILSGLWNENNFIVVKGSIILIGKFVRIFRNYYR